MSNSNAWFRVPWSVDRWGRLLAGSGILGFTVLGMCVHPAWFAGTLLASLNLLITSFTNRCIFHDVLIRLGAKEREDLFLPGGIPRPLPDQRLELPILDRTSNS